MRGNLLLDDPDEMAAEVEPFKQTGGGTICELSVVGMRCDPHKPTHLVQISQSTGINIVHATGFYIDSMLPEEAKSLTVREMTDFMVGEVVKGVGGSGVRCGVIYTGCSWPLGDTERRSLQAAALAQKETGEKMWEVREGGREGPGGSQVKNSLGTRLNIPPCGPH